MVPMQDEITPSPLSVLPSRPSEMVKHHQMFSEMDSAENRERVPFCLQPPGCQWATMLLPLAVSFQTNGVDSVASLLEEYPGRSGEAEPPFAPMLMLCTPLVSWSLLQSKIGKPILQNRAAK